MPTASHPTCWLMITSNETGSRTSKEGVPGDIVVVDAHPLKLRAERADMGSGRVYTITVHCKDASGNTSTATTTVSVPRSQDGK